MAVIKRKSCRALILTPANEILLIKIENPEGGWTGWITPGGGIEEEEDEIIALKRELYEELGENLIIGKKIWHRFHSFKWKGNTIEQEEDFYLVHTNHFLPKPDPNATDFNDLKEFRWWSLSDLKNSTEKFAPSNLSFHLKTLLEKGIPASPINVGI